MKISQKKTNTIWFHLYLASKNKKKKPTKLIETRKIGGRQKLCALWAKDEAGQNIQTSCCKSTLRDVIYSLVTIVRNTLLHIWKLLREHNLKALITRRKILSMYDEELTVVTISQNIQIPNHYIPYPKLMSIISELLKNRTMRKKKNSNMEYRSIMYIFFKIFSISFLFCLEIMCLIFKHYYSLRNWNRFVWNKPCFIPG